MTMTTLGELSLILAGGVLGSAHCIGMCGGISATMSLGTRSFVSSIIRQLLWSFGRISTYVFLGISTSACGAGFLQSQSNAVLLQAAMAILAGLLLMAQGLHATRWIPWKIRRQSAPSCVTRSVFAQFLKGGSATGAFVAGLLTGFLPCGLVYSFLALSVSTGSALRGAAVMLSFGLGTIPVMLATGTGFAMVTLALRRRVLRMAAICVLATGILTMVRGITFAVSHSGNDDPAGNCPLCAEKTSPASGPTGLAGRP